MAILRQNLAHPLAKCRRCCLAIFCSIFVFPAWGEIYCAAVSGLEHDQSGAFQRIYPHFIGPQVAGNAQTLPGNVHLPASATGALRLGQYYCPVFPSWPDLKKYYLALAATSQPSAEQSAGILPLPFMGRPAQLPQIIVFHLAHGTCGGGISTDHNILESAESIVGQLYDLASAYQVALINDACYGSDLQLAKLRYEMANFQHNYPVHSRATYKVGRVCVISSAPLGQVTRGTPLVKNICQTTEDNLPRATIAGGPEDTVAFFAQAIEILAGQSLLAPNAPESLLAGKNLVQILAGEPQVFWSALDFDHLGVSDVLYYDLLAAHHEGLADWAAKQLAQGAMQSTQYMFKKVSEGLWSLAQSSWWRQQRRLLKNTSSRYWMRPIIEDQVAPLIYWALANQYGRIPASLQDLMFYYHGGFAFKEEVLAWLERFDFQWGTVEQHRALRWLRDEFPSQQFKTAAQIKAAFEKGRGRKIWAFFPAALADLATGSPATADQSVTALNACFRWAKRNLREKLQALPAQTKVAFNFIARSLEENFYQRPNQNAAEEDALPNCYNLRTQYGLSYFKTQWPEVFYEATDALQLILQGNDPTSEIGMAWAALVADDYALPLALASMAQIEPAPYDITQITFWQMMLDHVLARNFTSERPDQDPVSLGNFEPWGMVLAHLSRLKMPTTFWHQSLPAAGLPGEELDYLRLSACWPFGVALQGAEGGATD